MFKIYFTLTLSVLVILLKPSSGHFGSIRLKYGQPCKSDYECSTSFKCIDSSCRCPKNSVWSLWHQRCKVCPYQWVPYNDQCYFISNFKKDWYGAKFECEKRKSSLLVIGPEHVLDFSINFFSTFRLDGQFHIGAKADVLPSNWTWLSGESIPSSGHIWSDCYSPMRNDADPLKLTHGCALVSKFGLSTSNCRNVERFICYNDENTKRGQSVFTKVEHSFEIMNLIEKRCKYDYQCVHGQQCLNNICQCQPGSIYAYASRKCLQGTVVGFIDYLASKQHHDLFVSKFEMSWFDGYMWTETNKMNLFAPKNLLDLVHLLEFVGQNNLQGPFWIGGIRIGTSNFLVDRTLITDGPWFRSFKNCPAGSLNPPVQAENLCLAIDKNELVFLDCLNDYKFIAFDGSLKNSINLTQLNIPLPVVVLTRTIVIVDVIIVNPRVGPLRSMALQTDSPILEEIKNLILGQMRTIFISYTCIGFWISKPGGSFALTVSASSAEFTESEFENKKQLAVEYYNAFSLLFIQNKPVYESILIPAFTIVKIEIDFFRIVDTREERFLTEIIKTKLICVGALITSLECQVSVEIEPTEKTTTVPSTTVLSTTVPSTTVLSTTVPSTTDLSTTFPSTTVFSTTVPSTTVLSTTFPSTTDFSTSVSSTTVHFTTSSSTDPAP
uniref:Lysine-specific demethylase PHF2-1 n=1 Tax=Brachionus koreanus TaxID=1199090 RepID=A0A513TZJ2_9BILA|nr:lysine-specific demethylase PHF2-1 [Brachionus koreanus]